MSKLTLAKFKAALFEVQALGFIQIKIAKTKALAILMVQVTGLEPA